MIYLTEKQLKLLSEMLPVMQAFYNADFAPMCDMLGAENNVPKEEIEAAKEVLSAFSRRLLAPVSAMVDFCREFADKVEKAAQINQKTPTDLCPGALRRSIDCTKQEVYRLNCVLDTYTRLFLGQFFVIFEQLDIKNQDVFTEFADCRWHGAGGLLEVRDSLIPSVNGFGWNGNNGISNPNNPSKCKLAYEMCKVTDSHSDKFILHLSGEPLMVVKTNL